MRLERIKIHSFRRLVDTGCFLTGKLTAFVGPNEAGKSSLLDALMLTNQPDEVSSRDWPRGGATTKEHPCLELRYRLDADDVDALSGLFTRNTAIWFYLEMDHGGRTSCWTEPLLRRPPAVRRKAAVALNRYSGTRSAQSLQRTGDDEGVGTMLDVVSALVVNEADLDEDSAHVVDALASSLEQFSGLGARAASALREWLTEELMERPDERAADILFSRRPKFAWFGDAERTLASDYNLPDVADDPPAALSNLARLAGLDLQRLHTAVATADAGLTESLTEAANARLRTVFEDAWLQSPTFLRLKQDGQTLRLLVSIEGGGFSSIAERSDGLRTFAALTAFGALRDSRTNGVILLIDEAERHLHYDAQADLIRMLERQEVADQVLYTTHSAGCLPLDLGTGVRPVIPVPERPGSSRLANNFWTEGPGFMPLLLAMGAGAAAFTPSRYAVLTEGATEMLLLPSLMREATGRDQLHYQVAPGIAEATNEQLRTLDLEGARVAYLVDGDRGGAAHAARLAAAGVPRDKIVSLGGATSDISLEDLLLVDVYVAALNEALVRKHGRGLRVASLNVSASVSRSKTVDAWCRKHALAPVSKAAVAAALLEIPATRRLTIEGKKILKIAHKELSLALGLPT